MMYIENIVLIIIGILIIRVAVSIYNIKKSLIFLSRYKSYPKFFPDNLPYIVIVIPVLLEQRIIEETVKYFSSMDYPREKIKVLMITTEKEYSIKSDYKESTINLLEKLKKKYPQIKTLHYPTIDGCKSDQLNFAAEEFEELYPDLDPANTFFAIYDADSRPNKKSLKVFSWSLQENPTCNVFQQSAIFLKNYEYLNRKSLIERLFLKSATLEQNRFTLAYEIPRILRKYNYSKTHKGILSPITYAHCVGHGLIIRLSFLKKIKFPTKFYPEDMFYGFILNSLKEPIVPIPALDTSEMPVSCKRLFIQRAFWFLGHFSANKYRNYVKNSFKEIYSKERFRIIALSGSVFSNSIRWLLTSFFGYFLIICAIILGNNIALLTGLLCITYLYSFYITLTAYKDLCKFAGKTEVSLSISEKISIVLFEVIFMLFYSIPAYYMLCHTIANRISKLS